MKDKPALLLDNQLCFATCAASRAMVQAYRPLLEPLGLTYPQYLAMLVLWEQDDLSLKALGERLELDSGTLTPLVKRLERRGLVLRQRDTSDERVLRVRLSEAGRALREQAQNIPARLLGQLGFDHADDIRALREALRAITRALRGATTRDSAAPDAERRSQAQGPDQET